jgi:Neuraminidase (sialidase)
MRRLVPSTALAVGSIVALAVATAAVAAFTSKVSVDPSPVAACSAPAGGGTVFNNTEVEPFVAANPAQAHNLVAVWQQDRWSNGGAHALMAARSTDGGQTWNSQTALPFNECAPGGLSYERASDPWVSFGPDGTAYAVGLVFNISNNDNGVAAVRSTNGGATWDHLTVIRQDLNQNQLANDKESVTADPYKPGYAYAVWDQLVGPVDNPAVLAHNFQSFTGPTYFARTTDGGATWSQSKIILPMRQRQQSIANVIVVGPGDVLYDFFTLITATGPNNGPNSTAPHGLAIAFMKSSDNGTTWSDPHIVQQMDSLTVTDPNTGAPLRTADFDAAPAVDPRTGQLYLVWQDARDTAGKNHKGGWSRILYTTSTNGGDTWSDPVVISKQSADGISAILPAIAVGSEGTVGITYYDFTGLTPDNTTTLPTTVWSTKDLGQTRTKVAGPFNFLAAPNAGGAFLGDYQGLAADGTSFVGVNDITNCNDADCGSNPTDTYGFGLP